MMHSNITLRPEFELSIDDLHVAALAEFADNEHAQATLNQHYATLQRDGIWNMNGVRRVPYRLTELLRADDVFIVEGEKDADNLSTLGFTATTNSGGAGKWKPEYKYAEHFKAHQHVMIFPDNDDAGRKHAQQVAESLTGKVASLKLISLSGLPPKADISDWIQQRRDDGADDQAIKEARSTIIDGWPEAHELMAVGILSALVDQNHAYRSPPR
jgi:5S rRNA maturation endonuclease (ribonuclease M5)